MAKCKKCAQKNGMGFLPEGDELTGLVAGLAGAISSRIVKNKLLSQVPIFQSNMLFNDIARIAAGLGLAGLETGSPMLKPFGEGMAIEGGLAAIQRIGGAALENFVGGYGGSEFAASTKPMPFPSLAGTEFVGKDGSPLPFPSLAGTEFVGENGSPLPFPSLAGTEFVGEDELIIN